MSEQQDDLAKSIEDGSYFKEARRWYDQLYLAPISQRIFFIVVTSVAGLVFLMTFMSVMNLLPLSPRLPFVYRNAQMAMETPRMERFKRPNEDANPALIRYFLSEYIKRRESYNPREMQANYHFVKNYSKDSEFRGYATQVSSNNPQSPVRRYGRFKEMRVQIREVSYQREAMPYTAVVDFSTIVADKLTEQKTNWTASITFDYTDLIARDSYDEDIGDYVLDFDEPRFMVKEYDKRERLEVK